MKKTLYITSAFASLIVASCGDKESENTATSDKVAGTQSSLETSAKEALAEEINGLTGEFTMDTPPYMTMTGPLYTLTNNKAANLIYADIKWVWKSSEPLYKLKNHITTESGEVPVIQTTKKKGVVAESITKAIFETNEGIAILASMGPSKFSQFSPSISAFRDLGKPQKFFDNAVIYGSPEFLEATKSAKAYNAKIEAERHAKQLEIEKKAAAKKVAEEQQQQAQLSKLLASFAKDGDFVGFVTSGDYRVKVKIFNFNIEEKGGIKTASFNIGYYSNNKFESNNIAISTFTAKITKEASLKFLPLKEALKYAAPSFIRSNGKIQLSATDHIDRISLTAQSSKHQFQGELIRQ